MVRTKTSFLVSATAIFVCLCPSILAQLPPPKSSRTQSEDDIREVILRSEMEEWIKAGDRGEAEAKDETEKRISRALNFKFFFVAINGKDPDDSLMNRLHGIPRVLKKVSSCEVAKAVRMPIVDKETQELGIIFQVGEIRWLGTGHVKVEGGYHCDGLCAGGYSFDVYFEKGKWVVKQKKLNWVS